MRKESVFFIELIYSYGLEFTHAKPNVVCGPCVSAHSALARTLLANVNVNT